LDSEGEKKEGGNGTLWHGMAWNASGYRQALMAESKSNEEHSRASKGIPRKTVTTSFAKKKKPIRLVTLDTKLQI
jgi:hypothetical protein